MTQLFHLQGWYEQNTEGLGTIYLAITDEGVLTQPTDTPASVAFPPRIRNPETFSIRRVANFWPWGDSSDSLAVFGQLEIDNYDGAFDFMLNADLRDAPVVFKIIPAGMLAGATTVADGLTVATAIIDDITADTEDVVRVTFKDTLARLDRPLNVRYWPPYVDSNAANRMVQMNFGACRNVSPTLIAQDGFDGSGEPVYGLHDSSLGNIAQIRDMGAILQPGADPPQYIPALNRSGVQLHSLPEGKLLADVSSVGTQDIAPGVVDVLDGIGLLTDWPVAGSAPTGWTYGSGTSFTRVGTTSFPQDYCMFMQTKARYGTGGDTGLYAYVTTPFLQPGQTYRIRFKLDAMYPSVPVEGGFLLRTDLTNGAAGEVSGSALGPYLLTPTLGDQNYTFEYTCPNDGTVRTLYVIMVGAGVTNPTWGGVWHGITVELLGQFAEAELESITLNDYITNEILYLRAYEDTSIVNSASLQAIDDATQYGFGIHFEEAPNIYRDCICGPLPSYCATVITDADGVLQFPRLVDPKLQTPIAAFSMIETARPIQITPDRAQYLTTVMGARRNWTISGPSDFVTDYALVPADVRMRYGRTSQYQVTSSKTPAGQYSHAIGAPVFDSLLDDPADAQTEIDRVVGLYSPTVYDDGTIFNGKRRFVVFTLYFDDAGVLGDQTLGNLSAPDLLIGDTITLTYSHANGVAIFDETPIFVAGTELFPFGNKLIVTGWY